MFFFFFKIMSRPFRSFFFQAGDGVNYIRFTQAEFGNSKRGPHDLLTGLYLEGNELRVIAGQGFNYMFRAITTIPRGRFS